MIWQCLGCSAKAAKGPFTTFFLLALTYPKRPPCPDRSLVMPGMSICSKARINEEQSLQLLRLVLQRVHIAGAAPILVVGQICSKYTMIFEFVACMRCVQVRGRMRPHVREVGGSGRDHQEWQQILGFADDVMI